MSESRNYKRVTPIRPGRIISADYLNSHGEAINRNTKALSGPRQQYALEESERGGGATGLDLDFAETSRSSTTVTVTDSGGDTFDIEQIDSVTFQNSAGDTLTLTFNNP